MLELISLPNCFLIGKRKYISLEVQGIPKIHIKKNKLQSIPDFTKKAVLWTHPLFLPVNYLCQTFFHQKSKIQFIGESENLLLSSSLFNLYSFDLSLWERVLKSFHFNLFSMDSIKKIKKKQLKNNFTQQPLSLH